MSSHEQYRACWPNDDWVWDAMTNRPEFFNKFDALCRRLEGLSVPKSLWPVVHVRTVTVVTQESAWVEWGEHQRQEHQRNNTPLTYPVRIVGESSIWGQITRSHIDRIRNKEHSLTDPCVICGIKFQDCDHTTQDTELFIQYIRNTYPDELRRKR